MADAAMNRSFCFSFVHLPSAIQLSPLQNTYVQPRFRGWAIPTLAMGCEATRHSRLAASDELEAESTISLELQIEQLRAGNAKLRDERDIARSKLEALLHQLDGKRSERFVDEGFGPSFADRAVTEPTVPPHGDEAPDDEAHGCWEFGIDTFAYSSDVLKRLATTPTSQIDSLTPCGWVREPQG